MMSSGDRSVADSVPLYSHLMVKPLIYHIGSGLYMQNVRSAVIMKTHPTLAIHLIPIPLNYEVKLLISQENV